MPPGAAQPGVPVTPLFVCPVGEAESRFLRTNKGGVQLVHGNFIYNQENRAGDKISWKCMEYFRLRCRGRCQTVNFRVTKVTDVHCHPPVPEIIKKKMAERQNQPQTDT